MVSVLYKKLKYKAEMHVQELEVLGHEAEEQNQIQTYSWYLVNHP